MTKDKVSLQENDEGDKQDPRIAIPILKHAVPEVLETTSSRNIIKEPWVELILGHGERDMPFSTARFAAKKGKR